VQAAGFAVLQAAQPSVPTAQVALAVAMKMEQTRRRAINLDIFKNLFYVIFYFLF